jgi:hypothetical protein
MATPKITDKKKAQAKNKTTAAKISAGLEITESDRGAPTKYKKEYAQQLIDYFKAGIKAYERVELPNGEGRTRTEVVPVEFPTFQEFSVMRCNVSFETLCTWAKEKKVCGGLKFPEFSEAYSQARDLQAAILTKGSMVGAYEGKFAGLAAKNLIGWADKLESTVTEVPGMTAQQAAELNAVYEHAHEAAKALKNKRRKSLGN